MPVSGMVNVDMKSQELGEHFKPLTPVPDPISAMMMTEYAVRQARVNKIEILRGIVSQRNHRRATAILNNKEIREITAKIEENKISILQIHNINSVLEQSRSHYIDEQMKQFDEENPCKEMEELIELEKLEEKAKYNDFQKITNINGYEQTGVWTTTDTNVGSTYPTTTTNIKYDGRSIRQHPF